MIQHWTEFPPVHVSLAGIVRGLGGNKTSKRSRQISKHDMESFDHTTRKGDSIPMQTGTSVTMLKRRSPVSPEELEKIEIARTREDLGLN